MKRMWRRFLKECLRCLAIVGQSELVARGYEQRF